MTYEFPRLRYYYADATEPLTYTKEKIRVEWLYTIYYRHLISKWKISCAKKGNDNTYNIILVRPDWALRNAIDAVGKRKYSITVMPTINKK